MNVGSRPAGSSSINEKAWLSTSVLRTDVSWIRLVSLVGLLNLAFLAGALAALSDWPPAGVLRKGFAGLRAWPQRLWPVPKGKGGPLDAKTTQQGPGVVVDDSSRTWDGFTLVTTTAGCSTQLIDMRGQVVHKWSLPFSKAWPKARHVILPARDGDLHWFRAHPYPNGDLLAVYHAENDTPYGYGLAKLDKHSKVLWTYSACVHHDVNVGVDGRIFVLTQRIASSGEWEDLKDSEVESYLADSLVILSPNGEELRRLDLTEALLGSPFRLLLQLGQSDLLHANSVRVLNPDRAKRFPLFQQGQVLVSFRNQDVLAVVDPVQGALVWAARGPWHRQHDAEFLEDGRLLVFDNMGDVLTRGLFSPERERTEQSRVLEIDPVTQAVTWCYEGTADAPFFTRMRGTKQRLPNGNTLIVDADHGVMFEVTRLGRTVWRCYSASGPENTHKDVVITGAHRYGERDLPFMKGTPTRALSE